MNQARYCPSCGSKLNEQTLSCSKCDASFPLEIKPSKKSGKTALFLCVLLGIFGVHRFYVGKIITGIINLCTLGLFGIWVLIDLILITQNKFKDNKGCIVLCNKKTSFLSKIIITFSAIITWIVITFGAFLLFANYITAGLVNTVNGQLNALSRGNYKEAYAYNATEYKKVFSLNYFTTWVQQFPELSNNKYAIFDQRSINSYNKWLDAGFIEGTLISKNGKQITIKYILIKENGTWKIVAIMPHYQPTLSQ